MALTKVQIPILSFRQVKELKAQKPHQSKDQVATILVIECLKDFIAKQGTESHSWNPRYYTLQKVLIYFP